MALTSQEQKAVEYAAAEKRRAEFGRFLQGKLKAPDGPAMATKRKWWPLLRR